MTLQLFLFLALSAGSSGGGPTPTPVPERLHTARSSRVTEGIALHDKGDFEGAIRKYEEALKVNPQDAEALYELAYSYSKKGDLKKAIEVATEGLRIESPFRPGLSLLIGNLRDDRGDSAGAIEAYRSGLKERPDVYLLHYNLGLTLFRLKRWDEARKSLETSVSLKPDHASSHFILAQTYANEGYKMPALLAFSRFLILEPSSSRSGEGLEWIDRLFHRGVEVDQISGNTKLTVDSDAKKDEGDFTGPEVGMLIAQSASDLDRTEGEKKEPAITIGRLAGTLSMVAELDPATKSSGFAWNYYLPYFLESGKRGYTEALSYHAYQSSRVAGVRQWLESHRLLVEESLAWSRDYQWNIRPTGQQSAPDPHRSSRPSPTKGSSSFNSCASDVRVASDARR